jgi:IS605 OrfB family transposase
MNKTVACKLTPTPDQQAALLETLDLFAGACNAALKVAQETGKQLAYDIHHVCYCDIKESAGLTSNYVIRAIARVAASFGKKNPPNQADVNHCISRRIVEEAKATNKAIVLEDLSGIRKRGDDKGKRMRRMLGRWAFYQLRAFIEYKAKEAGVEVIIIKSAKFISIQSVSLDGDEFRIVGVSPTINLCYSLHSSLKLKFAGSGRKSAG